MTLTTELLGSGIDDLKKIGGSSQWATMMNLVAATVGAGIMSLPSAVAEVGWVPGFGLLAAATLVSVLACQLVARSMDLAPQSESSEDIACAAFGPTAEKVVMVVNNCDLFATCVVLLVAGKDACLNISTELSEQQWLLVVGCVCSVLSLPKDMSGLAAASSFGVLTLVVFVVSYVLDAYVTDGNIGGQVSGIWEIPSLAGSASNIGFSYSCAILMPSLHKDMAEPQKLPRVIYKAHALVFTVYCIVAYSGYAWHGISLEDDDKKGINVMVSPAFRMIAGVSILVTILVGYPIFLNPISVTIEKWLNPNAERETATRIATRLAIAGSSLFCALVLPFFYQIVSVTGAVTANSMCVIFPICFFCGLVVKRHPEGIPRRYFMLALPITIAFAYGLSIMGIGVYFSCKDLAKAVEEKYGA